MDSARIVIIGAGFSGLGMGARLLAKGITDFVILEAGTEVGGTWRDNRYPGCACDIPSHLYSFSFDRNPNWTYKFSRQPEIWAYLREMCDRHGLRRYIRFQRSVVEATWDAASHRWHIATTEGESYQASILIAGTGPLSIPAVPQVPGLDRFGGPAFHSSAWRHDVDLRDQRVAVVGTGASAIQLVPEIAPEVAKLHLFQRTPPWVIPRPDRPFGDFERRLLRTIPGLTRLYRYATYVTQELRAFGFVSEPRVLQLVQKLVTRFIEESIDDPRLREEVTPSYTLGCKRVLRSSDYYPALNRRNVELIASPLASVDENSVTAADGRKREVDVIIWGTGFGVRDFMSRVRVVGNDGVELNEAWRRGIEAYYGMNVSGFPNLFLMLGPNTGLGHNSVVFMAEAQIHYILRCLDMMERRGYREIDVLPEEQRAFNTEIQSRMTQAVWMTGCRSWYLDDLGRNDTLWPGYTFSYWLQTRRPRWHAYRTV